jgi:hypothetical protein
MRYSEYQSIAHGFANDEEYVTKTTRKRTASQTSLILRYFF